MNQIIEFFGGLFDTDMWPPRWRCGYWSDFHGWLYIISDLLIWASYFLIPLIILNYFSKKKNQLKFNKAYIYFAAFIVLCGCTHFIDAIMFWVPMYRLNTIVRFVTAIISLMTVYHLIKILPEAFSQKTNAELEAEIQKRLAVEQKLQEANFGLQSFASMASHDLQEPLRKMRFFTSILDEKAKGKVDESTYEYVNKIEKAAERMQILIEDLLSLSSIDNNIELTPTDTNQSVRNAIDDLELPIRLQNAEINTSSLPMVNGNEAYLTQLFLNLISNALKFNSERPIINISGEKNGQHVIIRVEDNGIGIEEKNHKKIFESFLRLHSKSAYAGTGIGLSICKSIVEVHKGSIEVESEIGKGSTFIIKLEAAE